VNYHYEVHLRRASWDSFMQLCRCDSAQSAAEVVHVILKVKDPDVIEVTIRVVPADR
jgi:hypothetical protein